jgi:uncharacterized membrane protein/glutaredoxin
MGRKARTKREQDHQPRHAATPPSGPNWPILGLSLAGIALTGYLLWADSSGSALQGCSIDSACDVVLSSRWATLLGMPTATWGLLAYLTLAGTAFFLRGARQWKVSWTLAFVGLLYSVYLTTISVTLLGATCPYCLTSLALMTALFVVATIQRPVGMAGFAWGRWLGRAAAAGVVAIGLLPLNYVGVLGQPPAVENPYAKALAIHLSQRGAKMYGASWCPHCIEQKDLFGTAAKRLPYVECSPGGTGSAQAQVCRAAGITNYPTWIIDGKRIQEVITLPRLAELTGFTPPSAPSPRP